MNYMILRLNGMRRTLEILMNKIIYKLWFWIGCKCRLFREYNVQRDKSLLVAREALERAFSPQLKKMLDEEYNKQ